MTTGNSLGQHASNTHGGPRPKVRADDGRVNNSGPGRKPQSFTLKLGDTHVVFTFDKYGTPTNDGESWVVTEIDRDFLTFTTEEGDQFSIQLASIIFCRGSRSHDSGSIAGADRAVAVSEIAAGTGDGGHGQKRPASATAKAASR